MSCVCSGIEVGEEHRSSVGDGVFPPQERFDGAGSCQKVLESCPVVCGIVVGDQGAKPCRQIVSDPQTVVAIRVLCEDTGDSPIECHTVEVFAKDGWCGRCEERVQGLDKKGYPFVAQGFFRQDEACVVNAFCGVMPEGVDGVDEVTPLLVSGFGERVSGGQPIDGAVNMGLCVEIEQGDGTGLNGPLCAVWERLERPHHAIGLWCVQHFLKVGFCRKQQQEGQALFSDLKGGLQSVYAHHVFEENPGVLWRDLVHAVTEAVFVCGEIKAILGQGCVCLCPDKPLGREVLGCVGVHGWAFWGKDVLRVWKWTAEHPSMVM